MKKVFVILVFIWTVLSVLRVGNSLIKIPSEELQWFGLSQDQKKEKLYGYIWKDYKNIDFQTSLNTKILIDGQDGKEYFLLRYLLYPKKVYWSKLVHVQNLNQYFVFKTR